MVPTRPTRSIGPALAALGLALLGAACSSGAGTGSSTDASAGTGTPATTTAASATTFPTATTPHPTGTAGSTAPEIVRFDLPSQLECTGATGELSASYETVDTSTVAFLVDQRPTSGAPPTSGTFTITLPCDGRAHTILVVAVGPSGQAVATRAVLAGKASSGGSDGSDGSGG